MTSVLEGWLTVVIGKAVAFSFNSRLMGDLNLLQSREGFRKRFMSRGSYCHEEALWTLILPIEL